MPQRDAIHSTVRQALVKDGWSITDDPYVVSFGERLLCIDLAASEFTLRSGKVWVEYDGLEQGISQSLARAGIPEEQIVLAFLPELSGGAITA